jgi:L-alanine-DL-glutamate epimerase-like enolase superfamily enzyme
MQVEFRQVDWPFASVFRIAYRAQTVAETVWAILNDGLLTARGEGLGVFYHGETTDSLLTQLNAVKAKFETGTSRLELQKLLPPGGARNALDCALWDLEAKRLGRRAWELAGIPYVKPLLTAYTLSMGTPAAMAAAAVAAQKYSLLKLKLGGDGDLERVVAVRDVRPDAALIVDANQAWGERQLREIAPKLDELGVKLIEQPLRADEDQPLAGFNSPVPLCADESCQTTESLPSLVGKYQYINIKLDKTGGLTEALRLARAAQAANFKLMVGCMAGSSLAMAPHFVVGQLCSIVDLDGPLLSASDVPHAIRYEGSQMHAPERTLWG